MTGKKKSKSAAANVQQLISMISKLNLDRPAPKRKAKKRRPKKTGGLSQKEGSMTISRRELLQAVSTTATTDTATGKIELYPDKFAFLKGVAKSFERFRFSKMHLYWKPAVGTNYGGMIAMGVEWDFSSTKTLDRTGVTSFTPSVSVACWSDTESRPLVLPKNRLQSRDWYSTSGAGFDAGPGRLHYCANGEKGAKTLGELWVEYTIEFMGTQMPE